MILNFSSDSFQNQHNLSTLITIDQKNQYKKEDPVMQWWPMLVIPALGAGAEAGYSLEFKASLVYKFSFRKPRLHRENLS